MCKWSKLTDSVVITDLFPSLKPACDTQDDLWMQDDLSAERSKACGTTPNPLKLILDLCSDLGGLFFFFLLNEDTCAYPGGQI